LGLSILAIGVWAWTEKDTFNNLSLLTNIALDPAFIFILAGKKTVWGNFLRYYYDKSTLSRNIIQNFVFVIKALTSLAVFILSRRRSTQQARLGFGIDRVLIKREA